MMFTPFVKFFDVDYSQYRNTEHVLLNTDFFSGGFFVIHVLCHFFKEVSVLNAQVARALPAKVAQEHTPHCRQTGISEISS